MANREDVIIRYPDGSTWTGRHPRSLPLDPTGRHEVIFYDPTEGIVVTAPAAHETTEESYKVS